jgi:hypothetical protein
MNSELWHIEGLFTLLLKSHRNEITHYVAFTVSSVRYRAVWTGGNPPSVELCVCLLLPVNIVCDIWMQCKCFTRIVILVGIQTPCALFLQLSLNSSGSSWNDVGLSWLLICWRALMHLCIGQLHTARGDVVSESEAQGEVRRWGTSELSNWPSRVSLTPRSGVPFSEASCSRVSSEYRAESRHRVAVATSHSYSLQFDILLFSGIWNAVRPSAFMCLLLTTCLCFRVGT